MPPSNIIPHKEEGEEEAPESPRGPLHIWVLNSADQIIPRTDYEREALGLLKNRNFAHVTVFDPTLLIKMGLGHDMDHAFKHAGWEHFHSIMEQGSSLLTMEFLMSLNIETTHTEMVFRFRFFNEDFVLNARDFSNALGFTKRCILDPNVLEKSHRYERTSWWNSISIDDFSSKNNITSIHNPTLWFLAKWIAMVVHPRADLHLR
jgi:hypothetical protein